MSFDFGDIVLVPFPFTDQTISKKRPAVVVSSSEYQRRRHKKLVLKRLGKLQPADIEGLRALLAEIFH